MASRPDTNENWKSLDQEQTLLRANTTNKAEEKDSSDLGRKSDVKKRKRENTTKETAEEKRGKRKRASEQLANQRRGKGKKSAEHIELKDRDEKPATDTPTSSKVDKERPSKRVNCANSGCGWRSGR